MAKCAWFSIVIILELKHNLKLSLVCQIRALLSFYKSIRTKTKIGKLQQQKLEFQNTIVKEGQECGLNYITNVLAHLKIENYG